MAKKLYVGGLPYSTTDDELREAFAKAGAVASVTILMDKMTGRSRGFGFVEMENDEDAAKAIDMWNGQDFGGRKLTVNEAKPMEPRAPRSNDSGGGGWWWKPPQLVTLRSIKQKSPCFGSGIFVIIYYFLNPASMIMSSNAGNGIPATLAALGSKLASVIPGIVLVSKI